MLLGGTSSERDVSIASGLRVADALRTRGHDVTAVDTARGVLDAAEERTILSGAAVVKTAPPSRDALAQLEQTSLSPTLATLPAIREADVVFLALHGGQGEDGTIQALLDLAGVRYTGSGHLASALAMDKDLSKRLMRAVGVPTADWLMAPAAPDEVERALGLPVVVKPSNEGSTVGLTVVKARDELARAVAEARRYDDAVMIERFVPGRELTVGILGDEALPVVEIIPKHEIYDYECKYTPGMAVEEVPAKIPPESAREVQRLARLAFAALKLGGYARIDFRMTPAREMVCLEANTLPGMTATSLIPQAAQARGMSFPELCDRIVALAVEERGGARREARAR